MRVFRNESMDRLLARRAERNVQSDSVFDNYLTSILNNNYGVFGSYSSSDSSNVFDPYNMLGSSSGNLFDPYNVLGSSSGNFFDPYNMFNSSVSGLSYSFSFEMKQALINSNIEKAISSGEPMRGVSYNEFLTYYLQKDGSIDKTTIQLYKQALRGDNAALRDKQWRTDPDYIIPERLYKNSLITADKEAALDKLARNEKLEDWEQRLLDTLTKKD